ncbi:hypothetical protein O181_097807, partial [Austropuccinia psidii MF-1]|nr:hypothetical protein [Austropuccinia psidii MF-1]
MVDLPSFQIFEWNFLVIDTPKGEELILGFDFLNHFNPSIDWRQGLITFNADNTDVTGALQSEEGLALSKLGLTYGGLRDM